MRSIATIKQDVKGKYLDLHGDYFINPSESARRKAMEDSGADDYIRKPFSAIELFNKFEEMLRHEVKT